MYEKTHWKKVVGKILLLEKTDLWTDTESRCQSMVRNLRGPASNSTSVRRGWSDLVPGKEVTRSLRREESLDAQPLRPS